MTTLSSSGKKRRNSLESIMQLAGQIHEMQQEQAVRVFQTCKPEVDRVILHHIEERQHIEHLLDLLLDSAFDEGILMLFKRLCRYYYFIDPQSTVLYKKSYREMWDAESL